MESAVNLKTRPLLTLEMKNTNKKEARCEASLFFYFFYSLSIIKHKMPCTTRRMPSSPHAMLSSA